MSKRWDEELRWSLQVFDNILSESPSFWIAEGKFLEDIKAYTGTWPSKVFMAMGTQEFSGTRSKQQPQFDEWMVDYVRPNPS